MLLSLSLHDRPAALKLENNLFDFVIIVLEREREREREREKKSARRDKVGRSFR